MFKSARTYFGTDYADLIDVAEGDFVFIPLFMPHVEANTSLTDEPIWMTTRTPYNIDDVPDATRRDYRRPTV